MRHRVWPVPRTILPALLALALPAAASAAPGVPEARTLSNGLTLVIHEDHALPLVAVSLWVHAGSKDEIETSAGYAHVLEHMVQRGTDTAGPFEYQRLAQRWGGSFIVRSNYDRTFLTLTGVPSVLGSLVDAAAAMAFRASLKDSEINLELGTLTQEIRTYYDQPSSVAFLETLRATFPGHPYRVPMLGNFRTLGTLKHDPLASFYRNLYVPNNMALVLAGDLDPKQAASLAEDAFGKELKSATLAPKPAPPAAFVGHQEITREKRLDLKESWTCLSFAGPGYRSPDRAAFEVIARALGEAAGSPLQMALLREKAGAAGRAVYYGLEDAGMLYVSLSPSTPQLSYTAARAALQEIVAFKKRGLKDADLKTLVELIIREERLRAEPLSELAGALGEAALFGGVRYYWDLPDVYSRLTPQEIRRVAEKYLIGDNVRLVVIVPKDTLPLPDEPKDKFHAVVDQLGGAPQGATPGFERRLYSGEEAARLNAAAWGNPRDAAGLKDPQRVVLDNGLAVVVQEDHRNALAAIVLEVAAGSADDPQGREGAASMVARLVAAGLAARARAEAARGSDRLLAVPQVQVSRDLMEVRLIVPPAGVSSGLSLLAAGIRRPPLDDAAIAAARKACLDALERGNTNAELVASELFREKVYAGGPNAHGALGTTSGLQALTRDDLAAFQAKQLRPSKLVIALAGDVASADAVKMVRDLFGDWKDTAASAASGGRSRAEIPARAGDFTRTLAAPESRAVVGIPGAPIDSPDFEALRLLGTEMTLQAFEDIVFRRRAAFSVTAMPEGLRDAGSLALEVVAPRLRIDEAVFDLQRLMRRLALEEMPQEEVEAIARVQAGRDAQALQGALAVASALGYREAAGLSTASYRKALVPAARLSPAQLKEVAGRYLKPESWIMVKVGPPSD